MNHFLLLREHKYHEDAHALEAHVLLGLHALHHAPKQVLKGERE